MLGAFDGRHVDSTEHTYNHERYLYLTALAKDKAQVAKAISRTYAGEKRIGLVVVFDNVDKRDRDTQLAIFEAAQWFKDLTRALVIVNLRDTCACRKLNPGISVMESAQDWATKNVPGAIDGARDRCILFHG